MSLSMKPAAAGLWLEAARRDLDAEGYCVVLGRVESPRPKAPLYEQTGAVPALAADGGALDLLA